MRVHNPEGGVRVNGTLGMFGQSLLSLSFDLGGMLAGTALAIYLNVFSLFPWSFILYPGILSIRGAIGGIFCGRLSTGLHLGTIRDRLLGNTRHFYTLCRLIVVLAFIGSLLLWVFSSISGVLVSGLGFPSLLAVLEVTTATMAVSLVLIPPIIVLVSFLSFRKGLDPDVIVYPVVSTAADILVTLCYVFVLNLFSVRVLGPFLVGMLDLAFLCFVLYAAFLLPRDRELFRAVRESILTLTIVAAIVNLTGLTLSGISRMIGRRSEVYVVYPALIDTVGDVGSIVGSTATTKLALGLITFNVPSMMRHFKETVGAWLASILFFTVYALTPTLMGMLPPEELAPFILTLHATNVMAIMPMFIIAYVTALLTFRRGWDPDNFVIPIESSIADLVTTLSLLAAIRLFG